MTKNRSLAFIGLLLGLVSLAPAQTAPFQRDGQPDPNYEVPDELSLHYSLLFALDNNYAIRQARERIREQEGVIVEIRSSQIPNVGVSGGVSGNDEEVSSSLPAQDRNWNVTVQATQVLYAGGGVRAATRSAALAKQAAELELQGVINEQLLAVRTRFYSVLLAQELVTVQDENIKLLEGQLKDAQNRFEAGSISNFEVLRARVALANGQPDLITARNNYRLAIEELRQVLGFTNASADQATRLPTFVGELKVEGYDAIDLRAAITAARANRPELQRLAKLEAAGEEQVVANRSGALPQVSAFGRYDWVRGGPGTGWSDRRDGWTAGVQAQWNIFDGRATAGRVVQAKSRLMQTKLALEESQLAIDVEVRRAHSSLTEAWELVEASGKVVEQADEALRLAKVRYSAGTATQLDVLTSQVELTRAKLNQLQAFYRYNVALASLRKAMGQTDAYIAG
ncbi:MAG: TolC family protein [Opitutaceae bacterium]|nr:TolC family protein [Cephaloticoccus sp.]MCP5530808.1 TolC family protein [Opitutaceae bacterium]